MLLGLAVGALLGAAAVFGVLRLTDTDSPGEPCAFFSDVSQDVPNSLRTRAAGNNRVLTQDDLDWAGKILDLKAQSCRD